MACLPYPPKEPHEATDRRDRYVTGLHSGSVKLSVATWILT